MMQRHIKAFRKKSKSRDIDPLTSIQLYLQSALPRTVKISALSQISVSDAILKFSLFKFYILTKRVKSIPDQHAGF